MGDTTAAAHVEIGERSIEVRVDVDGYHFWPQPTAHRRYLGERHRHRFQVTVALAVLHNEREVEFHDLMDRTREVLRTIATVDGAGVHDFGPSSCEHIAEAIAVGFAAEYERPVRVTVSEDGDASSSVTADWRA